MKAPNHPEYTEEQQHLEQAVAHIEAELVRPFHSGGADDRADYALALADKRYKVELQESLQQAYFARVDEKSGSAGRHTMYIGKHYIHRLNIYSWADTRAGDLYYKTTRDLLLKRNYEISYNALDAIRDQYVHASLADVLVAEQFTDSLLHKILQESRGGYLHDIVATIQEQQYHIIQAPRDTLLVVQGVPGSGKSSIALHRMAYLMYNHRATLKNILVLGPSRIFLDYIGNILPSLGEHDVPHRTFAAWLLEKLGNPVKHHPQEHLLEQLLDPATPDHERLARHRNALNKGSLQMASLLDRYVDVMQQRLFKGMQPLSCHVRLRRKQDASGQPIAIELKAERSTGAIQAHLDLLRSLPFNRRKPELERRLVSELASEMLDSAREQFRAHNLSPFSYDEKEIRRSIEEHLTRQVHDYFAWWTALNPSVAYRRLFQTPTLQQIGKGIFAAGDLETLALYRPKAQAPFDYADLAPLVYLKILLDGLEETPRSRSSKRPLVLYDHIVADEAQDISPLFFKVLDKYSRASSMTVLGDLAQGVYTENAINSWQDLLASTTVTTIQNEAVQQSYRSTRQIIEYANDMLRRTGADERHFAQPVARTGAKPHISLFYSRATFLAELRKIIRREQLASHTSIALICKTAVACRLLASDLPKDFPDYQLVDTPDTTYDGKLSIIPTYLTKGLEFDTVVVVDADAANYPADDLSTRLLYVALTRASHALYVCSVKTISPLLDETAHRVTIQPAFASIAEGSTIISPPRSGQDPSTKTQVRRVPGRRRDRIAK